MMGGIIWGCSIEYFTQVFHFSSDNKMKHTFILFKELNSTEKSIGATNNAH